MHLYLYLRGTPERVDLAKSVINGQFWQWTRFNNETKKDEDSIIQSVLRPSIFGAYELVFPEECLPDVLAFLNVANNLMAISHGKIKTGLKLKVLRAMIGCRKIPKKIIEQAKNTKADFVIKGTKRAICSMTNLNLCSIHVVGIKKDVRGKMGKYTQELL